MKNKAGANAPALKNPPAMPAILDCQQTAARMRMRVKRRPEKAQNREKRGRRIRRIKSAPPLNRFS